MGAVVAGRSKVELPAQVRAHDKVSQAVGGAIVQVFRDFSVFPYVEVLHLGQAVVQAVCIAFLGPDAGGQVARNFLDPFLRHYVVPANEALLGNFRHAVVAGQDKVDAVSVRQGFQAQVQGVHEAVHVLCHGFGFRGEGAVHMALVVRLVKIAHHQLRALHFREAHQAHNLVYALVKVPMRLLVPVAPVSGIFIPFRAYRDIRAHPVYYAAFYALLLGGNPDGLSAVEVRVKAGVVILDGIVAVCLRIPETVVHQSVMVRDQAGGHGVVVGEGGGGERGFHPGLYAHRGQGIEERHVVIIGIVPAASVQGNDDGVVFWFTAACRKTGQQGKEQEDLFHASIQLNNKSTKKLVYLRRLRR